MIILKKCTACGIEKDLSLFYKSKLGKYGRFSECIECTRIKHDRYAFENKEKKKVYDTEYRKKNKEKVSENGKKYYEKNKDLVLKRTKSYQKENKDRYKIIRQNRRTKLNNGGKLSHKEWLGVLEFYGNKCLCCGNKDTTLSIDHVIPVSLGGMNQVENIQPLCISCNSRKNNKHIDYRFDKGEHWKQQRY